MTFKLLRKEGDGWKESSSGKLRPQVGCPHVTPYVVDGGHLFAVWQQPYNFDFEKNTPLAVYLGDGTFVRMWKLFDLIPQRLLEKEMAFAQRLA